jgi:acetyl esterase/lipase
MKLKSIKHLIVIFLILQALVASAAWKPQKNRKLYRKALKRAWKIELYSHFFQKESECILHPDDSYYLARWKFLKELIYDNPEVQSPQAALGQFMDFCKKHGYLDAKNAEFAKAANILGSELITDYDKLNFKSDRIKECRDITYTMNDSYPQKLDLFLPRNPSGEKLPCVVFIHGGGWKVHKRAWMESYAKYFAHKGYAALTIDYRLVNAVSPVECVHDAKAAVRWVRANADKYNIDPDRIGACGGSAGAHLSVMLATTHTVEGLEGNGSNKSMSSKVHFVVGLATPSLTGKRMTFPWRRGDKPEWFDRVSPYHYADSTASPMVFVHGTKDKIVLYDEAVDLYQKCKGLGLDVKLDLLEGEGHVFYIDMKMVEKTFRYFEDYFSNTKK